MYVERRAGMEAWLFERLFDREMNDKFRVSFSMVCYLEMYIFKMFCDIYIYIFIYCVNGSDGKMLGNLKGGKNIYGR